MARSAKKMMDGAISETPFLSELYKKTKPLPFVAENGNQCVCINLSNCSRSFLAKLEEFISENPDQFRLVARGLDYYLEILGKETYSTAYQKSFRKH